MFIVPDDVDEVLTVVCPVFFVVDVTLLRPLCHPRCGVVPYPTFPSVDLPSPAVLRPLCSARQPTSILNCSFFDRPAALYAKILLLDTLIPAGLDPPCLATPPSSTLCCRVPGQSSSYRVDLLPSFIPSESCSVTFLHWSAEEREHCDQAKPQTPGIRR